MNNQELSVWRSDLHEEMTQMRELGISIPDEAFAICFVAKPSDYKGMTHSEAVDLIIQQSQVKS